MSMITGGLAFIAGAAKSIEHVPYGELAVKVRAGRYQRRFDGLWSDKKRAGDYYGYRGQGWAISMPFAERYVRVNTQLNVDPLPELPITSKEGLQMLIGSAVTWHVMGTDDNPYKALMKLNDSYNKNNLQELRELVVGIAAQGLSVVLNDVPRSAMFDFREIDGNVKDECGPRLLDYGVNLVQMQFKSPYESGPQLTKDAAVEAAQIQAEATRELAAAHIEAARILSEAVRDSGQSQHVAATMALNNILSQTGQRPYLTPVPGSVSYPQAAPGSQA